MSYSVRRVDAAPAHVPDWGDPTWSAANAVAISHFHPKSSDHRPTTAARVLHIGSELFVQFQVQDRFVRCVNTEFQSRVSQDSCVEFFLQPRPGSGYFNFEINCGGAMLVYYIEDPTRTETAFFRKYVKVSEPLGRMVRITASLPRRVDPEIAEPITWGICCAVPLCFFEEYLGRLGPLGGQTWRGNFFKCADGTSHPHWAAWHPIGEILRFHQPDRFAPILFE